MKRNGNMTRRVLIHLSLARKTRRVVLSLVTFAVATLFVLVACSAPQNQSAQSNNQPQAAATDWKPVEQALGKAGSMQPGDVYKVSLPRSDLKVHRRRRGTQTSARPRFMGGLQEGWRHDDGDGRPRAY